MQRPHHVGMETTSGSQKGVIDGERVQQAFAEYKAEIIAEIAAEKTSLRRSGGDYFKIAAEKTSAQLLRSLPAATSAPRASYRSSIRMCPECVPEALGLEKARERVENLIPNLQLASQTAMTSTTW